MAKDVYDGTEAPPLTTPLEIEAQSRVVKIKLTPEVINSWLIPDWQRHVRTNPKGRQLCEDIKEIPILESMIIVGVIQRRGKYVLYLLDGHHRKEHFLKSGAPYIIIDVKFAYVETMGEMADLYLKCQDQIVKSSPNDNLKGLAVNSKTLNHIIKHCTCVTLDAARSGASNASVTMSTVIQVWYDSNLDPPKRNTLGSPPKSITDLAKKLTMRDAETIVAFIKICEEVFGFNNESSALWKHINLVLCLWLYRVMVLKTEWEGCEGYKVTYLDDKRFGIGLSALRHSRFYSSMTNKRLGSAVDRKEAYLNMTRWFLSGFPNNNGRTRVRLPKPTWASKKG